MPRRLAAIIRVASVNQRVLLVRCSETAAEVLKTTSCSVMRMGVGDGPATSPSGVYSGSSRTSGVAAGAAGNTDISFSSSPCGVDGRMYRLLMGATYGQWSLRGTSGGLPVFIRISPTPYRDARGSAQ